ncbi:CopD family protein [Alcanivorax quisquiliarum]|uniref:Protoporphyrinogen IX oxidase n=1 Tax=Alcanivorax quisquiliarum TaxID=2933565 RepID=A0ABT0E6D2_9GAMM|nr:CopD family protein [Alcanivorax quisquiliarum]MCK0537381.1 CopD family protein [Alcanivorax quisquiliarum]
MLWLLTLHIAGLLCWSAAILCVPTLLLNDRLFQTGATTAGAARETGHTEGTTVIARRAFIWVATPAALIAVGSGTLLFTLMTTLAPWMLFKLVLVSALVLMHVSIGLLMLRAERAGHAERTPGWLAGGASATMLALMLAIVVLVLAKPEL